MKIHIAFVLIFWYMKIVSLQGVNGQNIENEPDANTFSEINKADAAVGVSLINEGLSSENLSDIHRLAKNISNFKGIYIRTDEETESDNVREIRRSIRRKIAVSTESDVIKSLIYSLHLDNEDKLKILEKMEYLVHQYDVAINFANLGGIDAITALLLSSDDKIVSSAASVLGAALQSNPTVQKLAVKVNVGENLVKKLSHESPVVLSKIIFALGSFLRNEPEAQEIFFKVNCASKLTEILKKQDISTNTKLKIINIFSDLSVEQQTAKIYPSERSLQSIHKLEMLFNTEIQNSNICELIPTFLNLEEDFDTHQKIVAAMTSLSIICLKDFNNEEVYSRLNKLLKLYDPESDWEGPVYSLIDKGLKRSMYDELKYLFKEINMNAKNRSITGGGLKTEL